MDIMKAPEVYLASNLDGMISDNFAGYIWSIKMKARNYIGLMILTSLLLSGCQATPAQDIVANKNDHQTEQSKAESVARFNGSYRRVKRLFQKDILNPLILTAVM